MSSDTTFKRHICAYECLSHLQKVCFRISILGDAKSSFYKVIYHVINFLRWPICCDFANISHSNIAFCFASTKPCPNYFLYFLPNHSQTRYYKTYTYNNIYKHIHADAKYLVIYRHLLRTLLFKNNRVPTSLHSIKCTSDMPYLTHISYWYWKW